MEIDTATTTNDEKKEVSKDEKAEKKEEEKVPEKKEPEPDFEMKSNPARVTLLQVKYLSFNVDARYQPVREEEAFGIVMLKDSMPGAPEEFVKDVVVQSGTQSAASDEPEPEPPAPFQYDPSKEK